MADLDVSVIIANYNTAKYIERAVRSALSQDGVTLEVIVIDDKSTDDSLEVLARISDPRLKIISSEVNQGVSATRNMGWNIAQGEWVAVLDADDAYRPGRLKRMITLAKNANSEIVVDNLYVLPESGAPEFVMFAPRIFNKMHYLSLTKLMGGRITFMKGYALACLKPIFSRQFIEKINLRYDPIMRTGEDYLVLAEAIACGGRCIVDHTDGYLYTARIGSTSYRISAKNVEYELKSEILFSQKHKLAGRVLFAHMCRVLLLKEKLAYTKIVEALKEKEFFLAFKIWILCPSSLRHFWESIWVRLKRHLPS